MKELIFKDFDNIIKNKKNKIPLSISNIIFSYYTYECNKCGLNQKYCQGCHRYQCFCIPSLTKCQINQCNNYLCCGTDDHICKDYHCNNIFHKYGILCERCYRLDIMKEIMKEPKS